MSLGFQKACVSAQCFIILLLNFKVLKILSTPFLILLMTGIFQQWPQETFSHKFSMLDFFDCLLCSFLLKQCDKMNHLKHPQFVWLCFKQIHKFLLFFQNTDIYGHLGAI